MNKLCHLICLSLAVTGALNSTPQLVAEEQSIEADLLIVGGTESGCAAAIQAARMGVKSIVLVSDTPWIGGQFTAESLVAIDENRGPAGYGHGVPFPRNGLFLELLTRLEANNQQKYGKARPGNTRVITTCHPRDALIAFQQLLAPYIESGQILPRYEWHPAEVLVAKGDRNRVTGVRFEHVNQPADRLNVTAKLTIDASDWGDVVRGSGNPFMFGPDLKKQFGEPLAPEGREGYPLTDMNPITYCMLLEQASEPNTIVRPAGYDPRRYRNHGYPEDPKWLYESRRIVDGTDPEVTASDVVLLCFPAFDYPLDQLPQNVVEALEANEPGASQKNIVQMTRAQREIVFNDAKLHSLGFLYYLQTEVAENFPQHSELFRRMRLVDDFGTVDALPPKPYIRESLRTQAMYIMKQQDTTGFADRSECFAQVMYHDGVGSWQFEYDFHPTRRNFLNGDSAGPWQAAFRPGRTWGPPYSGRCLLAARSLVPDRVDGLLVAQKNLGYTSLVSSALRLHDQSMMVGQAVGAMAAVTLREDIAPRAIPMSRRYLDQVWEGLCADTDDNAAVTLWPFADLAPDDPCFCPANRLAVLKCLPVTPFETRFRPDQPATAAWRQQVVDRTMLVKVADADPVVPDGELTRGEFATLWWRQIKDLPVREWESIGLNDADGDGIENSKDPLPFETQENSWAGTEFPPELDGLPPDFAAPSGKLVRVNFGGSNTPEREGWRLDSGRAFDPDRGAGWKRDLTANHRNRSKLNDSLRDTFLFTRTHDVWEIELPRGTYSVTLCIGDPGFEQVSQNVTIEGQPLFKDVTTNGFLEGNSTATVKDGRLTVEIGRPGSTTNTCLVWCIIEPKAE